MQTAKLSHRPSPVFSLSKAVPWAKVMLIRPVAPGVGCGARGNKADLDISPDMSMSGQSRGAGDKVSVLGQTDEQTKQGILGRLVEIRIKPAV